MLQMPGMVDIQPGKLHTMSGAKKEAMVTTDQKDRLSNPSKPDYIIMYLRCQTYNCSV